MTRLTAFALSLGLAIAGFARASDHFAIIRNSDNESHPVATLEVASVEETTVTFTVFAASGGSGSAKGVTLLLGNPNQDDIEVDIEQGGELQRVPIASLGVLAVPLTAANHRYNTATVGLPGAEPKIVAALVFTEKGRSSRMVMLTPVV